MKRKLKAIADLHGWGHQNLKLLEEMGELSTAITKSMLNIKTKELRENYISELADVKIMLEQVIYLSKAEKEVQQEMERKVDRQIQRMQDAGIKVPVLEKSAAGWTDALMKRFTERV